MMTPPEMYLCCLNPRERDVAREIIETSPIYAAFIPKLGYELIWGIRGIELSNKLARNFTASYLMTEGTIEIPGVGELEVFFLNEELWTLLREAYDNGLFTCTSRCELLTFTE